MCVSAGWVWSGLQKPVVHGRRANTAIPGTVPVGFFPPKLRCADSRGFMCLCFGYRSTMCFTWATTFNSLWRQRSLQRRRRQWQHPRKCLTQFLNLIVAFSASICTSSRPSRSLCVVCTCDTDVYHVSR